MKLTKEDLKWPQIDAAFRFLYDMGGVAYTLPRGLCDVYEFGVYKCGSLKKICSYLRDNDFSLTQMVYGFDSWEGLPEEAEGVEVFGKFTAGEYKAEKPDLIKLRKELQHEELYLIDKWFSDLNREDVEKFSMLPAMLVHIDADLYISTKHALRWMFDNKLIVKGTLVAFDEYKSTVGCAGEEKAWLETMEEYSVKANEVWHSIYYDKDTKQEIRQSLWEVLSC